MHTSFLQLLVQLPVLLLLNLFATELVPQPRTLQSFRIYVLLAILLHRIQVLFGVGLVALLSAQGARVEELFIERLFLISSQRGTKESVVTIIMVHCH